MTVFQPGLCTVTFRQLSPEDIVALSAECGIVGIEWAGDVHVPAGQIDVARHVRSLTEEAGLSVVSYGSYIAPPSDDERAFATVLETAQALGAPNIRIWPGTRNRDSATYSSAERRQVAQAIRHMARMADDASVTLSLEYHPGSLTDDLGSAQRLMAEIDDPNVFLYWQPWPGLHLETALEEIRAVGPETSHVHVFAWDRRKSVPAGRPEELLEHGSEGDAGNTVARRTLRHDRVRQGRQSRSVQGRCRHVSSIVGRGTGPTGWNDLTSITTPAEGDASHTLAAGKSGKPKGGSYENLC